MSYILDALKKAERERKRGVAPGIDAAHGKYRPEPLKKVRGLFWVMAGLALVGLALVLMLFFFPGENKMGKDRGPELVAREQSQGLQKRDETVEENAAELLPPATLLKKSGPVEEKVEAPLTTSHTPPSPASLQQKTIAPPQPREKKLPTEPASLAALPLSAEVEKRLPAMIFAGHTYSDIPEKRLIMVNGAVVREGGRLAPGVLLVEIVWEGLIIEFEDQRYLLPIK